MLSKDKKDTKLLQENINKYSGIRGANAWTNILEPPPKEINPIKTIPPLRNDEKQNLPDENSKRHKRMCMEILIENEKTKVFKKRMLSKEKKDTKLLQENINKYSGVRLSYATTVEAALANDNTTIEIKGANAWTNILEPPPKEINPIKTIPPLRNDEKENLPGENSKRHKRMCMEILIENEKTKVFKKRMLSKEKKDTKLLQENLNKYSGVRLSYATTVEAALAYDNTTIEIRGANAWTNILEPPSKEINPIKTIPPLRNDEKENLPDENSKRHKRMCMEILIENEKTKVFKKRMLSKEKKDTKLLQENINKYSGVRLSYATTVEAALAYDNTTIEIRGANAWTNILEPPPKEINPIKTIPPLRKSYATTVEAALANDNTTIEIKGANAWTNILEPPPKEINPIKTIPPLK
ncbi:hypothetical protein H5410_036653 [Solanum commersonii]|uniref:Uncharacterized protein n=1 Tax=Solanum commersonii TaxID=4109 RepID=A0A9J5Y5G6_SOLCO|nr:hypothetical protein H5410_036653 [Solanum commersonii]